MDNNEIKDENNSLKCCDILLDTAKSEYNYEFSRSTIIDVKSHIVLILSSALFIVVFQLSGFKNIFDTNILKFIDVFAPMITLLSLIVSLISLILAILKFAKSIKMGNYEKVSAQFLYNDEAMREDRQEFLFALSALYVNATINNQRINDDKVKKYEKGIFYLIVSIIGFATYIVITNLF